MKTKVDEEDLLTMAGPAYPTGNNHPLAMTAPKPRLHHHRLFNNNSDCCGESSASGGSGSFDGGCGDTEEIIRKNLFALPLVVQNEIFRTKSTATNHHRSQMIHQRPSTGCKPPRSTPPTIGGGNSPKKTIGAGGGGAATCGKQSSVSVNRRTGSDEFCGLSAEIYREIANRTPQKMNANAAVETPTRTTEKRSVPKAPVSRDLFRAKSSVSAFFPPATDGTLSIQLTPTKSMSSGSGSEGGSPAHRGSKRGLPDNGSNGASGVTPKTLPHKKQRTTTARKTPFASSSSARKKLQKSLTPPRNTFGSHMKLYRASSAAAATLGSSFDGVDDYRPTSTELDPSPFQVELPSKKEVMVYSRICALMDVYTSVHRDFNFAMLSGVSHPTLRRECDRSTPERPMIAGSCHRDVVGGLLGCHDDIVVEGFFREYTEEEKDRESERIEACILSSESLRQIIVCFRGSTTNQAKPLRNSMFGREGPCILHEDQKVQVVDAFRSAYFGTPLEKTLFTLLANLEMRKPFFDVAITGHSFGAAMATIASFRYASSRPQMRVSCHVFGSPRVGGEEWRQMVHSVPNLRLYRVVNGSDPFVLLPHGNEWVHCGHAIHISDVMTCKGKVGVTIKARRFDRDRSCTVNANLLGFVQSMVIPKNLTQGSSQGKINHEIQSYVEKLKRTGTHWFDDFCELKGKGVSGTDDEMRIMA